MALIVKSPPDWRMIRRIKSTIIYFRRFVNHFRTSSPYVSGDSISDLCGTVYFPHRYWRFRAKFRRINDNGLVFCASSNLSLLPTEAISDGRFPVLVLGNGDHDFSHAELMQLRQIAKRIFVQNLNFEIDDVKVLPIGVENVRLGKNGRISLIQNKVSWNEKSNRVLIGPFSNTHSERLELLKFSDTSDLWDVQTNFVSPKSYAKIAAKYKYIACPRGNGLDTHRFWETLYRGSIPIVKESNWARLIEGLGVPLLTVPEWTPKELGKAVASAQITDYDPNSVAALWIEFWDDVFTSDLGESTS